MPLKGDVFARNMLNRIPPENLFAEKDYDHWLPIDVSLSQNSEITSIIPRSIAIPFEDESTFIASFRKKLTAYKDDPFRTLLIFNNQGEQYRKIEKLLKKTGLENLFFLEGGALAYKALLDRQAIIRQAKDRSAASPKNCVACQ